MPPSKQPNTTVRLQPIAFDLLGTLADEQGAALTTVLSRLLLWIASQPRDVRLCVLGSGGLEESTAAKYVARFDDPQLRAKQALVFEAVEAILRRGTVNYPYAGFVKHDDEYRLHRLARLVPPTRTPGKLARLLVSLRVVPGSRNVERSQVSDDWTEDEKVVANLVSQAFGRGFLESPLWFAVDAIRVELQRLWGIVERERGERTLAATVALTQLKHMIEQLGEIAEDASPALVLEIAESVRPIGRNAAGRLPPLADLVESAMPDARVLAAWKALHGVTQAAGGPEHGAIPEAAGRDVPPSSAGQPAPRSSVKLPAKPAPDTKQPKTGKATRPSKPEKRPKR